MEFVSPTDVLFMLAESHEQPMHVAGLQLFRPPVGAGPDFVTNTYAAMRARADVTPLFRKHPSSILGSGPHVGWSYDDDIDLEYHLRRSGLPSPGRVRELLELTSRLHSSPLDRHRPLWETHIIEGLSDGRFAVYTKMHHSLVDGVSALKFLQGALSADPADTEVNVPWAVRQEPPTDPPASSVMQRLSAAMSSVARYVPSTVALSRAALVEQQLSLPFRAPRTMLNVPIGQASRCAAQSWSLERIKAIKNATSASVNDVVLAMCAGALRTYLIEQEALPKSPLIALVPVNLRTEHDADGGNMVSGVLCNLATDTDDPPRRLEVIHASMRNSKGVLSQLPRAQAIALGAGLLLPAALGGIAGMAGRTRPPFNICISNVPGVREPLYCNGARLEANYPMSIAVAGQALNITLATSADSLDFGLVGCRTAVPHLQRLLGHLETALKDLERAVGI